jgi:Nuclease-related domain
MKSIADTDKLERRAQIAQRLGIGGMILLVGGMVLLFWKPEPMANATQVAGALIPSGFILANIGIFLANRWLKRPRPEDVLDAGLKSLGRGNRIYHYLLPGDHVLLTPSGVVVFEVVALDGQFTYRNARWKKKFNLTRTLRFFVEQRLGDPIKRAQASAQEISGLIADSVPNASIPVEPMVVFTSPIAEIEVDNPPIPIAVGTKLNKQLPLPQKALSDKLYTQVRDVLDEAAGLNER